MSYIGKNIKKIRTVKKLSQAQFAKLFNLARPSVGAYEEGRAEPKIDTIIQIANKYSLSIDLLLTKELTINELYRFDIFKKDLKERAISEASPLSSSRSLTPLVRIEEHLEYLVKFDNRDFIQNLDTIKLPSSTQPSRAFEMDGHEMELHHNGIHHKDIVIGTKIGSLSATSLVTGHVYAIITKDGISIKRLKSFKTTLVFQSDDPHYDDVELSKSQILELWEVLGAYSVQLHPPQLLEERMLLLETQIAKMRSK